MFEYIAEFLAWLPSDSDFGLMQTWLNEWANDHKIIITAALPTFYFVAKKTPWLWDNKLADWLKKRFGGGNA